MAKPELRDHRKFLKLKRLLGEPTPHVLGYLDCLWHRGYQTGNPYVGDSLDVEAAAEFPGEPGRFAKAALDAGFLDVDPDGFFLIHDLYDHAPKYAKQRMKRNGFAPEPVARVVHDGAETGPAGDQNGTNGTREAENRTACATKPKPNPRTQAENPSPNREQATAEAGARSAATAKGRGEDGEPTPGEFLAAWNETAKAAGWRLCVKMSPDRCESLRTRRKDPFWRDNWRAALARASPIPGLRGAGGRTWVANAEWFLRPGTVLKIIEGGYDGWSGEGVRVPAPDLRQRTIEDSQEFLRRTGGPT